MNLIISSLQWTVLNISVTDQRVTVHEKKRIFWNVRWRVLPDSSLSRKRLGVRLEDESMKTVVLRTLHMPTNRLHSMNVLQVTAKHLKKRSRKSVWSTSSGMVLKLLHWFDD
jgi:hypothetical protein